MENPSPRAGQPTADRSTLLLGVDGGGSHTVALLAAVPASGGTGDERVLGRGVAGPSNHCAVGRDRATESVDRAIEAAFAAAGLQRCAVEAACLGLAGCDRPDDRAMWADWASRIPLARQRAVENDAALVLAAGTPDGIGLGVIAGTGSFALAQAPDGRRRRSGGWGYLFGDEGSGYWVALAGLRAVARAVDGRGAETSLTAALLQRFGLDRAESLVPAIYGPPSDRAAIAELAAIVTQAAASGDRVAEGIVAAAAAELADAAVAAARVLERPAGQPVPLALAGSLLLESDLLRRRLLEALRMRGVSPDPIASVDEPARGALRIAYRLLTGSRL